MCIRDSATAQDEHEKVRALPTSPPVLSPGSTPGATRRNPFEMFAAAPAAVAAPADTEVPRDVAGTFESQYGAYGEPGQAAAPDSSEDHDGPEEATAMTRDRSLPAGTLSTADAYGGIAPEESETSRENISVPGGFPGEGAGTGAQTPKGTGAQELSAPPPSAPATAPPPSEPLVPPPAEVPPPMPAIQRAPTSWSCLLYTSDAADE